MRWKTRSAPVRSTRTAIPGYFASKALEMISATCRSTEVYQITLPSLRAASTNCGVILSVAGGAARRVAGAQLSALAAAADPSRACRGVGVAVAISFAPVSRFWNRLGIDGAKNLVEYRC